MTRPRKHRAGLTLTEVVVSLAVIAILIGLLLPAVQQARASAARLGCADRLRQIGVAVHGYESAHGKIPVNFCGDTSCLSAQAALLPHVEEDAAGRQIDWADTTMDFPGRPPVNAGPNRHLLAHAVKAFQCPADGRAVGGANSYRQSAGKPFSLPGPRGPLPRRLPGYTDGLSNTALFSERLVGGGPGPAGEALVIDAPPEVLAPACVQTQRPPAGRWPTDPYVGRTWLRSADRHTGYAHALPPNSRLRDCESDGWIGMGLMAARSAHPGGVNVLFADGHARFAADGVGLAVWRAWGTPNGGEVTD
ncbi:MAG: DUF1559 domain-containing protein [Gemmataceae bacterium]